MFFLIWTVDPNTVLDCAIPITQSSTLTSFFTCDSVQQDKENGEIFFLTSPVSGCVGMSFFRLIKTNTFYIFVIFFVFPRLRYFTSESSFFKNVYFTVIRALLHINTAPHASSWQLPSATTVSYCWQLDDPSGANEGYIPCSKA